MKILVIGSGGREHALAWKLRQSPRCEALFATHSENGGSATSAGEPGLCGHLVCLPPGLHKGF